MLIFFLEYVSLIVVQMDRGDFCRRDWWLFHEKMSETEKVKFVVANASAIGVAEYHVLILQMVRGDLSRVLVSLPHENV